MAGKLVIVSTLTHPDVMVLLKLGIELLQVVDLLVIEDILVKNLPLTKSRIFLSCTSVILWHSISMRRHITMENEWNVLVPCTMTGDRWNPGKSIRKKDFICIQIVASVLSSILAAMVISETENIKITIFYNFLISYLWKCFGTL